jgi:hypothetical protein
MRIEKEIELEFDGQDDYFMIIVDCIAEVNDEEIESLTVYYKNVDVTDILGDDERINEELFNEFDRLSYIECEASLVD